jgi:hypothetical protein
MRHDDIRKKYTRNGGLWNDKNTLFVIGEQMQYEWERDFIAMKWALERIDDFLQVAKKHDYFTGTLHIAKEELLKRLSEYSCPMNLKDEYKTKERCLLKDSCKCLLNAENKNVHPGNNTPHGEFD